MSINYGIKVVLVALLTLAAATVSFSAEAEDGAGTDACVVDNLVDVGAITNIDSAYAYPNLGIDESVYPCNDGANAVNAESSIDTSTFGDGVVDSVTVYVDITHSFRGDLWIQLSSPVGTTRTLYLDNGLMGCCGTAASNLYGWFDESSSNNPYALGDLAADTDFYTINFNGSIFRDHALDSYVGDTINGNWTMRVCDDGGGDSGTWNGWGISLVWSTTTTTTTTSSSTTTTTGGSDDDTADDDTDDDDTADDDTGDDDTADDDTGDDDTGDDDTADDDTGDDDTADDDTSDDDADDDFSHDGDDDDDDDDDSGCGC